MAAGKKNEKRNGENRIKTPAETWKDVVVISIAYPESTSINQSQFLLLSVD